MGRAKDQGGLGFRDLVCFNKALLAKQCWRLLQYPESMTAKIIKAKYYPKDSIRNAKLGSKPSFAWRSLLAGSDLLEEGIIWRIGNGNSVRVRGEKWIPQPTSFSTQTCSHLIGEDTVVADLIDDSSVQWNKLFIFQNFGKEEATAICNIPLSRFLHDDKIIWRATKTGEFSVRSAYHLEKERLEKMKGECSRGTKPQAMWKTIWGLQIPNAAKMFLWRACNNILPTKDNLKRRKVLEEDTCTFCCDSIETTHHILWDCPSSQDVWSVSERTLQKRNAGGENFCELVEMLMGRLQKKEMESFAMIAKCIWKRRNGVMHGGLFTHPSEVIRQATGLLNDYREANVKKLEIVESPLTVMQGWEPPGINFLKANWDVAILQTEIKRVIH
jgi:hypothetical protein